MPPGFPPSPYNTTKMYRYVQIFNKPRLKSGCGNSLSLQQTWQWESLVSGQFYFSNLLQFNI